MGALFFEDFTVGRRFESPSLVLTEAEILAFARRYDPQPFHLDAEAARQSPYGGLIASGLHTPTLTFQLFLDTGAPATASLGSARDAMGVVALLSTLPGGFALRLLTLRAGIYPPVRAVIRVPTP